MLAGVLVPCVRRNGLANSRLQAQPFDGSDSGANPDEAKSWGKIRVEAQPVKVRACHAPSTPSQGASTSHLDGV